MLLFKISSTHFKFIFMYEKKNSSVEDFAKGESFVTTAEKAQYEVFTRGTLPRETIEKWIVNDMRSAQSLIHGILSDEECLKVIVDHYYKVYKGLHTKKEG